MANIKISELNPLLTVQDADVLPIVDNAVTKKVTAAILRSYTQGNSVLLTGAQTVAGIKTFTSQLASSVATGTAPFSVASTTKVTNLNADLLDGLSSADFQATLSGTGIVKSTAGTISYLTDNTANWDSAYNDKINSAVVTGSGTNTLTLTQQDAGTITATWVNGTLIREVRNTTGATLTKGTIVYISGATGNKPTVTKAIATGDSTSAQTFGFIQSDLANNDNGYVVVVGDLTGVDTSAFAEGAQLYLSSTVAGTFTDVKQYAPAHLVYVGIVTRSHPTLGQIEVNIQNGYELDELHNVSAQNPSNGDILQYVTSTGLWTKVAGTTTNISEGTNLYFTNARSRSAISLTTTGTSGAATYNSTTGVLNVPNYADGGITSLNGLTALSQTFAVGTSGTDFGISSATSTHTFNLPTASATNRGALSSADWTTFNNKANTADLANYLPLAGGTLTGALNGTSATFTADATINGVKVGRGAGNIATNTSVGASSLNANTTGSSNTANGVNALLSNTTGSANTANGVSALRSNTTGSNNTANGVNALLSNTTGTYNSANGAYALYSNTTGSYNTANGVNALLSNTTGNSNTANGVSALYLNTTGNYNTSIGYTSLYNNTASNNTAVGFEAAYTNASGIGLTAIGYRALKLSTGNNNTALGFEAGSTNTTGVNNIFIGYQSTGVSITESNRTWIGNSSTTSTWLAGNVLIGTTTDAGYKLDVNGTARVSGAATFSSSVTATSFIKSGGTSSQFLKADGSVDSTTYQASLLSNPDGIVAIQSGAIKIEPTAQTLSLGESYATNLKNYFFTNSYSYAPSPVGYQYAKLIQQDLLNPASLILIPSAYKTGKVACSKPTIDLDFTRSNDTATRVNEYGLIEKVRTNLVLQSQTFDNASWTKTTDGQVTITANAEAAPDGTTTAEKMIPSAIAGFHCVAQTITLSAGEVTISVFAKAAENSFLQIFDSLTTDFANFNLTTGAVGSTSVYVASIQSAGNGWFRCTATKVVSSGSFVLRYGVVTTATAVRGESFTGNGTNGLLIWGAQAESGVATDYIATTSSAVSVGPVANVPRMDYTDSASPRLLLEPQRTNLVTYSEQFNNAAWLKSGNGVGVTPVVTANDGISPDGYQNADKIDLSLGGGTASSDWSWVYQTYSVTANQPQAVSIYLKAATAGDVGKVIRVGLISYVTHTLTADWTRVQLNQTIGSTASYSIGFRLRGSEGTASTASFYAWGAQLEQNAAYSSSYIPTLGAAVTRGADASYKTGISNLIGQTEGTLFAEVNLTTLQGAVARTFIDIGSASNRIFLGFTSLASNTIRLQIDTALAGQVVDFRAVVSSTGTIKVAAAYKTGDCALYVNGVAGTLVANGAISFTTISNLFLGQTISSTAILGDGISQALLFPTRLSNAELATLTTI